MRPKEVQQSQSSTDTMKWLLIVALLVGGIIANYFYYHVAWAIRATVGILLAILLLGIASQTAKGRQAWNFIKGSRVELRKVVWPTRPETVQTMLVVVVMVVITALLLWGIDSLFLWLVSWLTGQRG